MTLDPDVARLLREEVHKRRVPMKQAVNDALRRGLLPAPKPPRGKRFRVVPHETRLRPGIGVASFNALADELEDEEIVRRIRGA